MPSIMPSLNLPNIWGEGAIFAFSGLDGETCTASGFVATFGDAPYDLLIHTPRRRVLTVTPPERGQVRVATGDVLLVDTSTGALTMAFAAWHTLVGAVPDATRFALGMEDGTPAVAGDSVLLSATEKDAIALARRGACFALAYGRTPEEAQARALAGLDLDLDAVTNARLANQLAAPALPDPGRDRLLRKCLSVMKVNTLSAEAAIGQRWSTPDRVPHQHMWLWDSVFHTFAQNAIDPEVAWEFLWSVLALQRPDGCVSITAVVSGDSAAMTQPPVLAWGFWENYLAHRDKARLAEIFPRLERYVAWDCAHRDANGNGLLEWLIEEGERCRCGESGFDNSPRFDEAVPMDAVDFSTFIALEMDYLAQMAEELGETERAATWRVRSAAVSQAIHALLWDERDGFYYDRRLDGTFSRVKAVSGFLPFCLPDLPPAHAERLLAMLHDPAHFATAFPVPSVAISEPTFSTDMWRGPTWINLNWCLIRGLRRHGYQEVADALAERTIAMVQKYYEAYGVIFEFFDATDSVPPLACDRKGPRQEPYNIRRKYDSIRDYHWTAALTADLLLAGTRQPTSSERSARP